MTPTRMFGIDVVEVRGSKKSLKLKNKLIRVLTDGTFEDVLLNLRYWHNVQDTSNRTENIWFVDLCFPLWEG